MIKPDNPIFVHSDIGRGLLIAKRAKVKLNGSNIFSSLLDFLTSHIDEGDNRIFFPAPTISPPFLTVTRNPGSSPISISEYCLDASSLHIF